MNLIALSRRFGLGGWLELDSSVIGLYVRPIRGHFSFLRFRKHQRDWNSVSVSWIPQNSVVVSAKSPKNA